MVEHERFIARRRARFDGIDGKVNIPYGTALTCQDGFLMHKNQRVCAVGSQNGMDCFVQDDDGNGTLRGDLVGNIQRSLERRDADYQTRWNRVWASALCQKYRRPESEDYWLWARAFLMLRFLICRQSPRWFSEGDGCESERIVLERWRDGFGAALAH